MISEPATVTPCRAAVQHRRARDVGELARRSRIEVVRDHDVVGRHRRDVRHLHEVLERRAREHGPAAHHRRPVLVIVSCCALPTTTTVGSGPVAGLPSPSVSRFGQLVGAHDRLVADQRARRHARVHLEVELDHGALARRERACARARQRRREIRGADRDARRERRHAAVRLTHGQRRSASWSPRRRSCSRARCRSARRRSRGPRTGCRS